MNSNRWLGLMALVLLGAILAVQVMILRRLPQQRLVSMTDVRNAPADQRRDLILGLPMVQVYGTVDVQGTVDVENEPLQVQIVR